MRQLIGTPTSQEKFVIDCINALQTQDEFDPFLDEIYDKSDSFLLYAKYQMGAEYFSMTVCCDVAYFVQTCVKMNKLKAAHRLLTFLKVPEDQMTVEQRLSYHCLLGD